MGSAAKRNILIIGSGGMGRRHLKAFSEAGAALHCFDVDPSRVKAVVADFPMVKGHSRLEDIPVESLHGAVIVSPTDTHMHYAAWCAEGSLPFLVEKPISNRVEGVQEVIERVRKSRLAAGVAYPRRNSAAVRRMKTLVANGFIGELKAIHSVFSQDFRKYRPDYRETYYARLATGGGLLMDALSHHVDLVTHFGGEVKSVASMSDRSVFEGCEGEDSAVVILRFRNGILGSVTGNQFQKPNVDRIELIGTSGSLAYERVTGILSWNHSDKPAWEHERVDGNWDAVVRNQAAAFLLALDPDGSREALPTTLEEALHSLKVVLAARESNSQGRSVEI